MPDILCVSEEAIEAFEDTRREEDATDNKICLEVAEMDVYKVKDRFYFIASDKDIFLLNEDDKYSTKLSDTEIEELDFSVMWLGGEVTTKFLADDAGAVRALVKIVDNYTSMVPNEKFHGVALASQVTHLRAYLYEHILKEQRCFYTAIILSGDQRGTGKLQ